jgi:hypothetical protein
MCEVPASAYPCMPPPNPPPPPPQPPSPPSPPLPPSCEIARPAPARCPPAHLPLTQQAPSLLAQLPKPSHSSLPPACCPPAGAPAANGTLFCDATGCFTFNSRPSSFNQARTACQAAGGELYMPVSGSQQQSVEMYFRRRNQMPFYWIGVNRANKQQAYQRVDGEELPQIINTSPYTHWVS